LTLKVAAAYQHTVIGSSFTDYDVFSTPVDLRHHSFNYAPGVTLNADAEYRTPVSSQLVGFLGAHVTYDSKTYADLAESPLLRIDPYTILGVRAGVGANDGHWDVSLYGRNVTNRYYWTNAALGYDSVYRIAGMPATFGIQADFKWD
jgi:outer membrane receptor protein involved in Fe transport